MIGVLVRRGADLASTSLGQRLAPARQQVGADARPPAQRAVAIARCKRPTMPLSARHLVRRLKGVLVGLDSCAKVAQQSPRRPRVEPPAELAISWVTIIATKLANKLHAHRDVECPQRCEIRCDDLMKAGRSRETIKGSWDSSRGDGGAERRSAWSSAFSGGASASPRSACAMSPIHEQPVKRSSHMRKVTMQSPTARSRTVMPWRWHIGPP